MAAQPRSFHIAAGAGGYHPPEDTTFTKIFVGGLAWETQRETMRLYFEQFGEILEAVVITDKHTGRSKGYGFVHSASSKCELSVTALICCLLDRLILAVSGDI